MSFKDDISEAKSKELNYFHKSNEDFADDIIESNKNCWSCSTSIPVGKKYCEMHCGHPADEFDSFTGKCGSCGKSLNVNMMMTMAESTEASATTLTDNWYNIGNGLAQCKHCTFKSGSWTEFAEHFKEAHGIGEDEDSDFVIIESLASEGRTMEQVWNQASPSQRESIMYEGGIEYEEAGQLYFGDDGSDSDTIMGYTSGMNHGQSRWDAQNDSSMDALSNTSYDQLPSNIKSRVDSGIVSYGLDLEGESKASEGHIWGDWFSDNFKEVYTMDQSGTYRCKHCDAWFDMYMHSQETAKYHLKTEHGIGESKASEVNGDYIVNGIVVGKVTDFEPNNWFGKVELSAMPEFAEYGDLDPQAVVKGDDGVTYKSPRSGHGTSFDNDGNPIVDVTSYESKASEARKLNARQKKLIEEWVGSMSSPPMVITSDDLPYSLLSELRDINDFDGFESAIMRYASDLGNKQAMQGSNPYMHSSNYGSFESKASEGKWLEAGRKESAMLYDVKNSALMGDFEPFINLVKQGGGDWSYFEQNPNKEEILQQIDMELENLKMSQVDRGNWDALGMHQESKASESEDITLYDGIGDPNGVGYWWDFELPIDEIKHEQLSSILGIDQYKAWGFLTSAEQDRISNYKLNKVMSSEGFIKDMNLNKDSLRNYDLDSLINMWKDAQAYYQNPDNTWEDEDAEFYDELALVINEKKSRGD